MPDDELSRGVPETWNFATDDNANCQYRLRGCRISHKCMRLERFVGLGEAGSTDCFENWSNSVLLVIVVLLFRIARATSSRPS